MKIKSYYERTVEEALERASGEMGQDAVLVHSRRTPLELRHLGPYEVVFALPGSVGERSGGEPKKSQSADVAEASVSRQVDTRDSEMSLSLEMMHLRRQVEEIRRAVQPRELGAAVGVSPDSNERRARALLSEAGLEARLIGEIVGASTAALSGLPHIKGAEPSDSGPLWRALKPALAKRLKTPAAGTAERRVVALIGPPGSGKTTTLVKLALSHSATAVRPVHLISADSFRVGAMDHLKNYAAILGIGIDFADTPALILQAIEANRNKELVLIDTPGLSGPDFPMLDDLASLLRSHREIEKHLVLPATMRFRDLQRAIRNYERFGADRLLFTHLDETDNFASIYSAAAWSAIPLSFLSAGQQIPEDLEEGSNGRILDLLMGAKDNSHAS